MGILYKIIDTPNKDNKAVNITPSPVAKAQEIPDARPEPIEVAIVLSTFGPGIKTLRTKKLKAGIRLKTKTYK